MDDNEKTDKSQLYKVDLERHQADGHSFSYAVYSRMSEEGKAKALEDFGTIPIDVALAGEAMKIVAKICVNQSDYILPSTTISEAIFRILIANENAPMSVLDLHSRLAQAWASVIYLKNLSEDVVFKILEGPNNYGFGRA